MRPWASEWGAGNFSFWILQFYIFLLIFSRKTFFSYHIVGKMKFHHCWPPMEKCFWHPPAKNTSDSHACAR